MRIHMVQELLARARLDIERAAIELADECGPDGRHKTGSDLLDVKARVDALEARVAVVEANRDS